MTTSASTVVDDLLELVAALDRRVPGLEREGEREIAREAAELKSVALRRIAELRRAEVERSEFQSSHS